MSVFPKTRAAGYIAGTGPGELARARATILLARLGACEAILPGDGDVPAALPGLLRDLVLAVRDLAGPAWLGANGDDPDVAVFTVRQAVASPPDPARIDEICSRVLWARFAPGSGQADPGHGGTGPGQPAPSPPADGENRGTAASIRPLPRRVLGVAHPGQAGGPAGTYQEEDEMQSRDRFAASRMAACRMSSIAVAESASRSCPPGASSPRPGLGQWPGSGRRRQSARRA
jgi:hypothetical protein